MQAKTSKRHAFFMLCALAVLTSCGAFKDGKSPKYAIDPVCGMKADLSEAYSCKYKGVKYFFDSYHCKETFKMNPAKFVKTEK